MFASCAASITFCIASNTAGLNELYNVDTISFPLSTARKYCVRSFVPIEKKSTSLANLYAIIAVEGVSTIIPTFIFLS